MASRPVSVSLTGIRRHCRPVGENRKTELGNHLHEPSGSRVRHHRSAPGRVHRAAPTVLAPALARCFAYRPPVPTHTPPAHAPALPGPAVAPAPGTPAVAPPGPAVAPAPGTLAEAPPGPAVAPGPLGPAGGGAVAVALTLVGVVVVTVVVAVEFVPLPLELRPRSARLKRWRQLFLRPPVNDGECDNQSLISSRFCVLGCLHIVGVKYPIPPRANPDHDRVGEALGPTLAVSTTTGRPASRIAGRQRHGRAIWRLLDGVPMGR